MTKFDDLPRNTFRLVQWGTKFGRHPRSTTSSKNKGATWYDEEWRYGNGNDRWTDLTGRGRRGGPIE